MTPETAEKENGSFEDNRERCAALLDTLPGMAYRRRNDPGWTLEYVSGGCRELTGLSPGDLIGNRTISFKDLIARDKVKFVEETVGECCSDRDTFLVEYPLVTATGTLKWVRDEGRPIFSKTGDLVAVEGYISDITKRKQLEESLVLANRKIDILSSATRHDINNKLTILVGYLQLLGMDATDPQITGYAKILAKSVEDISVILKFTREYEKLATRAPEWQNIRELISDALSTIGSENVLSENSVSDVHVYADPLLSQAFFNLGENALRYGKTPASFRVWSEHRGNALYIILEDDGEGIAPDRKEKIFEFGAGNKTGYGLFLAREILSVTDIRIEETGTAGKGARFEIRVPEGKFRDIQ